MPGTIIGMPLINKYIIILMNMNFSFRLYLYFQLEGRRINNIYAIWYYERGFLLHQYEITITLEQDRRTLRGDLKSRYSNSITFMSANSFNITNGSMFGRSD